MSEQKPPPLLPIYVASRASIPERAAMWRKFRAQGVPIISTWIDEDGEGETESLPELWDRITSEIARASKVVLYAEPDDFPLKGALIEVGIALGMGKPVVCCLPGVAVSHRTMRPVGSWLQHRLVTRNNIIEQALAMRTPEPQAPADIKEQFERDGLRALASAPAPSAYLVMRISDHTATELTQVMNRQDAYKQYDDWAVNWTDVFLMQIIKGPRDEMQEASAPSSGGTGSKL